MLSDQDVDNVHESDDQCDCDVVGEDVGVNDVDERCNWESMMLIEEAMMLEEEDNGVSSVTK